MIYEITPVRHVPGKLADVAIRFEPGETLDGFTLLGFQIWEPRDGSPLRSITYPSRTWRLPNGGTGTVVLLRDERTDKFTDAPVSIALKAAMLAAYDAHVGPKAAKAARKGALVRAGQRVAAAPVAPPAAPPRVLRPRTAEPRGTIRHRVADAVAP
jgi:hypothetical protein